MKTISRYILTLVALLAVTTGAWADETLLTTITPTGDGTYSETTAGAVTVTPAGSFFYSGSSYGWRWDNYGSLTVTANEGYTITRCVFIQQGKNQSVTISEAPFALNFEEWLCYENPSMDGVTSIEVYGTAPAASPGTPVPLTRGTGEKINEWTLTNGMPAGNVTVSVDYFAQAEFAMSTGETPVALAPTAIDGVPANTDDPIVTPGTVANIGTTDDKQGTLMYFVSQSTDNTVPDAPDYDDDGWSENVPTANGLQEGNAYVWYYIKGAEPANIADRTDDNTRNDSDIKPLGTTGIVTLLPEPTYNVEFAEGTNPEAPAEPIWTASPAADVKKGQTVTVTYTGSKKVIGVKAEKKAAAPALLTLSVCGETIYYAEGETWAEAIQNHPTENKGWEIYDGDVSHDNLGFLLQNDDFVPGTAKIDPNASYGNTGV